MQDTPQHITWTLQGSHQSIAIWLSNELPPTIKCYDVQHVSLQQTAAYDSYPRQRLVVPPPVELNCEDKYFIKAILDI
jgi:hypothetical protein